MYGGCGGDRVGNGREVGGWLVLWLGGYVSWHRLTGWREGLSSVNIHVHLMYCCAVGGVWNCRAPAVFSV